MLVRIVKLFSYAFLCLALTVLAAVIPWAGCAVALLLCVCPIAWMLWRRAFSVRLIALPLLGMYLGVWVYAGNDVREHMRADEARKQAANQKKRRDEAAANAKWNELISEAESALADGDPRLAVDSLDAALSLRDVTLPKTRARGLLVDAVALSGDSTRIGHAASRIVSSMTRDDLNLTLANRFLPDEHRRPSDQVNKVLLRAVLPLASKKLAHLRQMEREQARRLQEEKEKKDKQRREMERQQIEQRLSADYKVGDGFRLGDFSYWIDEVKKRRCVGRVYSRTCASGGAIFVIVRFTIRNNSKRTRSALTDDFVLLDGHGNRYDASSDATTELVMSGRSKSFLLTQLHPGITKEGVTAFEVPMEVWDEGAVLEVPEKGLLGSRKATVRLR